MNRKERRTAQALANAKSTFHVSLHTQDTHVVKEWCTANGTNLSAYLRNIIHDEAESIVTERHALGAPKSPGDVGLISEQEAK